jgi:hypothetical protein
MRAYFVVMRMLNMMVSISFNICSIIKSGTYPKGGPKGAVRDGTFRRVCIPYQLGCDIETIIEKEE